MLACTCTVNVLVWLLCRAECALTHTAVNLESCSHKSKIEDCLGGKVDNDYNVNEFEVDEGVFKSPDLGTKLHCC